MRIHRVDRVYYPGLKSHPTHEIAESQMRGFGGLVTFTVKDSDWKETSRIVDAARIPKIAPSLGGVESLIEQPLVMSYYHCTPAEREALRHRRQHDSHVMWNRVRPKTWSPISNRRSTPIKSGTFALLQAERACSLCHPPSGIGVYTNRKHYNSPSFGHWFLHISFHPPWEGRAVHFHPPSGGSDGQTAGEGLTGKPLSSLRLDAHIEHWFLHKFFNFSDWCRCQCTGE